MQPSNVKPGKIYTPNSKSHVDPGSRGQSPSKETTKTGGAAQSLLENQNADGIRHPKTRRPPVPRDRHPVSSQAGGSFDLGSRQVPHLPDSPRYAPPPTSGPSKRPLPRSPAEVKSDYVDTVREVLAQDEQQAATMLGLDSLSKLDPKPQVITLGYVNNVSDCDHYLRFNHSFFRNNADKVVVVLDGLSEFGDSNGFAGAKQTAGLDRINHLKIVRIKEGPFSAVLSNLNYFGDLLKGAMPDQAKSLAKQLAAYLTEKMKDGSPFGSKEGSHKRLHALAEELIGVAKKGKDSLKISQMLNSLGFEFMRLSGADIRREAQSQEVSTMRAEQIATIAAQFPGKTILVRAGASDLYGGVVQKSTPPASDPGKSVASATEAIKGTNDRLLERSNVTEILSICIMSKPAKQGGKVAFDCLELTIGDSAKLKTQSPHISFVPSLFKAT